MLTFEVGPSSLLTTAGFTATPTDLLTAGTAVVARMRDELLEYFGLAVTSTASAATAAGTSPLTLDLAPTSDPRWTRAISDVANQIRAEVFRRLAPTGASTLDIQRVAKESVDFRWMPARKRLLDYIKGGNTIYFVIQSRTLAIPFVAGFERVPGGDIHMNPFTWNYASGAESMMYSSQRARAAHSATMYLLHEIGHGEGCMFPTRTRNNCETNETHNTEDVDAAVRHHVGVGRRNVYPSGSTSVYGNYLRVDDLPSLGAISRSRPAGQWVRMPSRRAMATGSP